LKRFLSISALLYAGTGLLITLLVVVFSLSAIEALDRNQQAVNALAVVTVKRNMFSAWDCLRNELGVERAAYAEPGVTPAALGKVISMHEQCDAKIAQTIGELNARRALWGVAGPTSLGVKRALYRESWPGVIVHLRTSIDLRPEERELQWAQTIDALTSEVQRQSIKLSKTLSGNDALVNEMLTISDLAWNVRADAGLYRRYLGDALRRRNPVFKPRMLDQLQGRIDARWSLINNTDDLYLVPSPLRIAIANASHNYFGNFDPWREKIVARLAEGEQLIISRQELLEKSNPGLYSLAMTSALALDLTERQARAQTAVADRNLTLSLSFMLFSICVALSAGAYFIWRVIRPLKKITQTMEVVALGNFDSEIPFETRQDEIGQFARTLHLFRDGAILRERLEIELVKQQAGREIEERSNRTKSDFLANMSHELRTPLNAVIGFSDIIASEVFGPGEPRYRDYAKDIHSASSHLLSLINDILDITKAEAGKMELSFELVDLACLVKECVRLVQGRADGYMISMAIDGPPSLIILVDRLRIKQVLLNLLSNAVKFSDKNGEVAINYGFDSLGNPTVRIRDQGIGIPSDMIPFVFESFRQVDTSLARKFEGTGLGLSLVKTFMDMHGGDIHIESKLGVGTEVTVSFPVSRCLVKVSDHQRMPCP
jgi:signal transduction histidine kinase